jgi:hypothetical protein
VQGGVPVAPGGLEARVRGADARRLVDRELLRDREVQRKVQEGIHGAAVGRPVPVEVALDRLEQAVVLGVQRHDLDHARLHRRQRLAVAVLVPGTGEKAPRLVARRR